MYQAAQALGKVLLSAKTPKFYVSLQIFPNDSAEKS